MRSVLKWFSDAWLRFAYAYERRAKYATPYRLEEILMLIQVLGLGSRTRIESKSVNKALTDDKLHDDDDKLPKSAEDWAELASDHREFFRVIGKDQEISLIARHIAKDEKGDKHLDAEFVRTLMQMAIDIYDRSLQQSRRLAILIALMTTIGSLAVTALTKLIDGSFSIR